MMISRSVDHHSPSLYTDILKAVKKPDELVGGLGNGALYAAETRYHRKGALHHTHIPEISLARNKNFSNVYKQALIKTQLPIIDHCFSQRCIGLSLCTRHCSGRCFTTGYFLSSQGKKVHTTKSCYSYEMLSH